MQKNLVTCENLIKIYKTDDIEVVALQGLDLEVASGEMIALVGASGSGKTTLMNILGGLDTPSAGRARVDEYDLTRLNEEQRTRYRNLVVGYLWQQSGRNLLPDLTAADNIELPQVLNGTGRAPSTKRTQELLALVGLAAMAKKKPAQLSGGEQQRIAIAVALANEPILLLADEPTGELDSVTAREIIACLRQINQQLGLTIILVTHDVAVASEVDRTLAIRDGRISTETIRRNQPLATEIGSNGSGVASTSTAIGLSLETHAESIFIDRIGILQLPKDVTERVILDGRADVSIAADHVELWPIDTLDDSRNDAASAGKSAVIGLSLHTHRESILVDHAGRLQLPREALERIPFHGRARVQVIDNHIELWPLTEL
ncbi:MAG TPA: ABC transporter ATP-binding protein [Ktedonobacteraceae bacterium]|nr:ABC transporter ATP-binding protein [Ktedonobacteraceae bacterium]